jgi:hypothetical protein
MSGSHTDELLERVSRSLKANSAEFVHKRRAGQNARHRWILIICLVFAAGVLAGALSMRII